MEILLLSCFVRLHWTDLLLGHTRLTTITTEVVHDSIPAISRLGHLLRGSLYYFECGAGDQEIIGKGAAGETTAIGAVAESLGLAMLAEASGRRRE